MNEAEASRERREARWREGIAKARAQLNCTCDEPNEAYDNDCPVHGFEDCIQ